MAEFNALPIYFSKRNMIPNVLILIVALFYFFNLNGGHDWGGDFSMYIHHAKNIATGVPYSQTGYVYNPDAAEYGPRAYPPVFPLLLAPIITFFGVNLLALKIPGIICFIIFLYFLNNWIITELSTVTRILFITMLGFSPPFFAQADLILSDIPFLLFTYIALYRINVAFAGYEYKRNYVFRDILTGFCIYLSYGTRSVGIILLPILLVFFFLKPKRYWRPTLVIILSSMILITVQSIIIPGTGSYLDQLNGSLSRTFSFVSTLFSYYLTLLIGLFPVSDGYWQKTIFLITFLFFIAGLFSRLKKCPSGFDLFFIVYFALLLLWPSVQNYRFLLPIIPIYFLIMIEGFTSLLERFCHNSSVRNAILIASLGLPGINYFFAYQKLVPRPVSAMDQPSTQEIFAYINRETQPDDVIVFFKPRVLALFTERNSMALAIPGNEMEPILRMKKNNVSWIVVRKNYDNGYQEEQFQLINRNPDYFQSKFENDNFQVYKFTPQE